MKAGECELHHHGDGDRVQLGGVLCWAGAIAPCHANPNWTLVFLMPAYPVVELTEKFLGQDYALAIGFGGLVVFYSLLSYYPIKYVQQRNVGG